jgi:uncharacterized protein (TIGR03118 family)
MNRSGFPVSNGTTSGSSVFMFATEDDTLSGWSPSVDLTHAFVAVNNSIVDHSDQQHRSAVYKGLAIASTSHGTLIYATNFRGGFFVEMYDSDFTLVKTFTDHTLRDSYAPFSIQKIGGKLFVTYAKLDSKKHDGCVRSWPWLHRHLRLRRQSAIALCCPRNAQLSLGPCACACQLPPDPDLC